MTPPAMRRWNTLLNYSLTRMFMKPSNWCFYADGYPCVVEKELLYQAIQSLPENQRMVLLYDFRLDLTDKEIAVRMEVTVRTVYNLRQRAFNKIRTYYELHGRGRDP